MSQSVLCNSSKYNSGNFIESTIINAIILQRNSRSRILAVSRILVLLSQKENEKSKVNSRCTIEYLFSCKLCEISKYTSSSNCCTVCRKSIFFPICFPCTLSARDARGVYVCLASVYPVIRDRCPCPSKTVGPTSRFGRRP